MSKDIFIVQPKLSVYLAILFPKDLSEILSLNDHEYFLLHVKIYGFRTTSIKKILFYCVGEDTGKENYLLIFESASEFKE